MDIKARVEEVTIRQDWVTVLISPKDAQVLIDVLHDICKRAKPDKFENFVIGDLITALTKAKVIEKKVVHEDPIIQTTERPTEIVNNAKLDTGAIDKAKVIEQIKSRVDPRNEKTIAIFIKESVEFGQKQFAIKTSPKSNTAEGLYDWLLENAIIRVDGSPNPDRK